MLVLQAVDNIKFDICFNSAGLYNMEFNVCVVFMYVMQISKWTIPH